jgi:hypothetical protein
VEGAGKGVYTCAASDGEDHAVLVVNTGAKKTFSLNLEGKCYAYLCKNGKRIQAASLDPASFALKKNEFVLFSTKALTIPE